MNKFDILNNNINILINSFFPLYSQIILGNKNFIITEIKRNKDTKINLTKLKNKKLNLEEIENEVYEEIKKEEKKKFENLKEKFKRQIDTFDNTIKDLELKKQIKEVFGINDFKDSTIDSQIDINIYKKMYNINNKKYNVQSANLINEYAEKKLKLINNKSNKFNINYKFDETKGIIFQGYNNVYIYELNIKLTEFNEINKKTKNLYNISCKEKLVNIKRLYNKIFTRKNKNKSKSKNKNNKYILINNKLINLDKTKNDIKEDNIKDNIKDIFNNKYFSNNINQKSLFLF